MENFPKIAVLLFFSLCLSIFFKIPILRQVLGFLWLSLIPGYALLRILNLENYEDTSYRVVFSAGSGLAIIMLFGFIFNAISITFNLVRPLSSIPFITVLGCLTFALLLLGHKNERKKQKITSPNFGIELADVSQILVLVTLPILGIIGALYHNISLLLLMMVGVALLTIISILLERWTPSKLFSLTIVACSIALLFHTALISKHLMGVDIFMEFYVFSQTKAEEIWIPPGNISWYSLIDDLRSLLSVTLLPTVGTAILGIEGENFFKIFYPMVFSMVPLALYIMYKQQVNLKIAFLSTMVYISLPTAFYGIEPLALCRQMLGQLFLVLSAILMVDKKLVLWKKKILLIILASALISTHYSLAFILLMYTMTFYIIPRVPLYFLQIRKKLGCRTINFAIILLFTALIFSWYTYISSSPLNHLLSSFNRIATTFIRDFSKPEARGFGGALSALSPFVPTSTVGLIHKILVYTHFFFIGIGIMVMMIKPKEFNVSYEYQLLSFANAVLIALVLIIPHLGTTFNATRFYAIAIMFLAPFYVLGGLFLTSSIIRITNNLKKINTEKLSLHIVTFVLITTFLFQVGFINHITNDYPYSYPLDLNRKEMSNRLEIKVLTHSLYFLDQEVISAEWLAKTMSANLQVYADWSSQSSVLKSYAILPDYRMIQITNNTKPNSKTYIYLKYITTQLGLISLPNGALLNSSDALPAIVSYNVIYSNGISDIYYVP